jgi:hypothetical protein
MASIFISYQSFLARKPLLGNVLTCGVHPPTISGRVQADEQTLFATGDSKLFHHTNLYKSIAGDRCGAIRIWT